MPLDSNTLVKSGQIARLFGLVVNHDLPTAKHSLRVGKLAARFAVKLGLSSSMIQLVSNAALLHDVGKVMVPAQLLNKADPLTKEEFEIIKRHPENGYKLIYEAFQPDVAKHLGEAILFHHEKYNGSGYPYGKAGDEIVLPARIVAIADAYEAMISERVYHEAMPQEKAKNILFEGKGSHFDPRLVELFFL